MNDSQTTLAQLRALANKFRDERDWRQFHAPKEMAIDLSIEAAEVLEHFRFKSDDEVAELLKSASKREEIGDELADCLWALLYLSDEMGIDLAGAFGKKLEKTARKYPVHLSKGKNKKYDEY
ncbi:nucleotide pyrophosphohydrolase [Candidatus Micrarchaeota archaeon]|nr:nucleotide pyrophosphohydrolase [Candidatus Micrarchaeota archaeon]MBI5177597.1 nucleotide pyrophosphohydrolase [Candidatus Micrarchaeota archaeon]